MTMRSVAVFCGARSGCDEFAAAARSLGRTLAERGVGVVYGGGAVGLMGELADGALGAGGRVVGVIPSSMVEQELAHRGVSELHVVQTMHERKALMVSLADAFVALPGGVGTLDELFEAVTWMQLGIHRCPVGVLNIGGFYDELLAFLNKGMLGGLIPSVTLGQIIVERESAALIQRLESMNGSVRAARAGAGEHEP